MSVCAACLRGRVRLAYPKCSILRQTPKRNREAICAKTDAAAATMQDRLSSHTAKFSYTVPLQLEPSPSDVDFQ
jgi:hypothetical protein